MTVEGMMAFSRGDAWQQDFQESAISYMDRFMHTAMPVDRDSQVFQHFESRTNTAAHIGTFFIGGMGLIKGHLGVSTWKGWSLDADLLAIDGSLNSGFGKVKSAAKIENNLPNNHIWQKASPLKNRTAEELHEMFLRKNFRPVGEAPMKGYGSYLHPKTGRKYYIDPKGKGRYRKPSHVDVFRHPDYKGSLKKKRFGYLDGN